MTEQGVRKFGAIIIESYSSNRVQIDRAELRPFEPEGQSNWLFPDTGRGCLIGPRGQKLPWMYSVTNCLVSYWSTPCGSVLIQALLPPWGLLGIKWPVAKAFSIWVSLLLTQFSFLSSIQIRYVPNKLSWLWIEQTEEKISTTHELNSDSHI